MRTHVTVSGINLTPYVVQGTYKVDSKDSYESWKDGNMLEHRVIIAQKIEGSFDIVCSNRANDISLDDFFDIWNSAVDNGVVTIGLFVPSINQFKALSCYFAITTKEHILSGDGSLIDVLTISVKER